MSTNMAKLPIAGRFKKRLQYQSKSKIVASANSAEGKRIAHSSVPKMAMDVAIAITVSGGFQL
jgi:hypothetical protein